MSRCLFIVLDTIKLNEINYAKKSTSGFEQQGGDLASLVTAYVALRPRDGFSHPHQEHMKDTYKPQPFVIYFYLKIKYCFLSKIKYNEHPSYLETLRVNTFLI